MVNRRDAARGERCERYCERARVAQTDQAERLIQAALREDAGDYDSILRIAEVLWSQKKYEEALLQYFKLRQLAPQDARIPLRLAECYWELKNADDSLAAAEDALNLNPRLTNALLMKAQILESRNAYPEALSCYQSVEQIDRASQEALLGQARVYLAQKRGDLAAPLLRTVSESRQASIGQRDFARWELGRAYAMQGRWLDAHNAISASTMSRELTAQDRELRDEIALNALRGSRVNQAFAVDEDLSSPVSNALQQSWQENP